VTLIIIIITDLYSAFRSEDTEALLAPGEGSYDRSDPMAMGLI